MKAGFDITVFDSVDEWRTILETLGLVEEPVKTDKGFIWKFTDGVIVTSYNPITLEHYGRDQKAHECMAGYIGIEGTHEFTSKAFIIIKETADYIKNEEYGNRSYI
ncbi:hypothetical protein FDI40_gp513 [Agrobacterium phage Atu_ph07]|uniref:Uncharacterized protein n=1 Tax=Agrobacterium phage Atu_ph07 TaxID=2024264 RepID=A0A2L0V0C4_9CAUD|nr:hypothetical protein FDI40_gp513 [Agrobacterium phage Atu_ph07]AUZ95272.1 hypothetical protein [Agrobacterium phage Atu_ph07]